MVRFLSLSAMASVLFLLSWTASYLLLPEGVLRGRSASALLAGMEAADSLVVEWIRIAAINLAIGGLAVVAANLVRTARAL
ncbi:MAG: hypothetical protein ACM3US_10295 [Sphingomonadaceae bacterium]